MYICLACDRESETSGFCVLCTIKNFLANGYVLSIHDCIRMSGELIKHPELIVKLTRKG